MAYNGPPWLNITESQWLMHPSDGGPRWTAKMDAEVMRFMDGTLPLKTAAKNCGVTRYRIEERAEAMMIASKGRVG